MATEPDVDPKTVNALRGLAHRVARIERHLGLVTEETLGDLTDDEIDNYRVQRMAERGGPLAEDDPVEVTHRSREAAKAANSGR